MRLKLLEGKQKELIKEFKSNNNLTWKELSDLLFIKEGKLRAYFYEECLIPKELFIKLDEKKKYKIFIEKSLLDNWGRSKGGLLSKGNKKKIRLPNDSLKLAEFYGIMLGDGNSTFIKDYKIGTYMIRIVGDSRFDKEYLVNYVKPLIEDLFNIKVGIGKFKQKNAMFIEAHSLELIKFLESKGFKPGNKIKNQLEIPGWIKKNKNYLKVCLRGLFDTDGSIYILTGQNLLQINFKNFNYTLLNDVREGLLSLDIICSRISKGNSIYITKKTELAKFFKLIGFKNSKHLNRIKMFKIAPSSSGQIFP
ncbi:MAG TPA: LAGLIDADG family homing endonuclease [Candidatus Paceibacterota bacterium]|nr:LAGLIDADG family homing endonuclease [Candidatus Paceibacterota bacterium]